MRCLSFGELGRVSLPSARVRPYVRPIRPMVCLPHFDGLLLWHAGRTAQRREHALVFFVCECVFVLLLNARARKLLQCITIRYNTIQYCCALALLNQRGPLAVLPQRPLLLSTHGTPSTPVRVALRAPLASAGGILWYSPPAVALHGGRY